MKKLRLIKPWRLRAVRQKLGDAHITGIELVDASFAPCAAPVSTEPVCGRFQVSDIRSVCSFPLHDAVPTEGPRSSVIFVARTKQSVR